MSELYDFTILQILQETVKLAVAASGTPTMPIKFEGRTWKVPNDQKWIELVMIPNNPASTFWGDEKSYAGMYRIILHWPNDDEGAYVPGAVLASIVGYFSKELFLQNVRIYDNPNFMGSIENGIETLYPVSLRYSCTRP